MNKPQEQQKQKPGSKKYLSLIYGTKRQVIPPVFNSPDWVRAELVLGKPEEDYKTRLARLEKIGSDEFDAISFQQGLQKLHLFEVTQTVEQFKRILKTEGFIHLSTPDLHRVVDYIKNDILEDAIYQSPIGPVYALDMVYGHRDQVKMDGLEAVYQSGFTAASLGRIVKDAGFYNIRVKREPAQIICAAHKPQTGVDISQEKIRVIDQNNQKGVPDELDSEPVQWKPINLGLKKSA